MFESIGTLADLLGQADFLLGLLAGAFGYALISGIELLRRHWGVVLTVAACLVIFSVDDPGLRVFVGIALLASGGWLWRRSMGLRVLGMSLIVAGAAVVASRMPESPTWLALGGAVEILAIGFALEAWA